MATASNNSEASAAAATTEEVTTTAQEKAKDAVLPVAGGKRPSSSSLESAATATTTTAKAAPGAASSTARVTLLLPLGNLAVVEIEGGNINGHGMLAVATTPPAFTAADGGTTSTRGCDVISGDGDGEDAGVTDDATESSNTERRLLRLEERVEILHCRGE